MPLVPSHKVSLDLGQYSFSILLKAHDWVSAGGCLHKR